MELPLNFHLSGRWNVISGKDCVLEQGKVIKYYSDRVLVVTGKSSGKKSGALADFEKLFKENGIIYEIFDEVKENPSFEDCAAAAKKFAAFNADGVLGIGGGSAMDSAKTIAVVLSNPDIKAPDLYARNIPCTPLPVFACGTTVGTGSEVTSYSVLTTTNGSSHSKDGYSNPYIVPTVCFCDPRYIATLPKNVILSTAIDALAHAIEAYFLKKSGIISRMFSEKTLEMMWQPFCKAINEELTYSDRERMLYGSVLGGFAIEFTGTCFPHGLGYQITLNFDIPHGFACGYFLGDFLRMQQTEYPEEVDKLLKIMNVESIDEFERVLYSVLPRFKNDANTLEILTQGGKTCRHLYNSFVSASAEITRDLYAKVLARL